MENSEFLERLLLDNKSLETLMGILGEENLKFFHVKALQKIANLLEAGHVVTDNEKDAFTEKILEQEGNALLCNKILKLLWRKGKATDTQKWVAAVNNPLLGFETPSTNHLNDSDGSQSGKQHKMQQAVPQSESSDENNDEPTDSEDLPRTRGRPHGRKGNLKRSHAVPSESKEPPKKTRLERELKSLSNSENFVDHNKSSGSRIHLRSVRSVANESRSLRRNVRPAVTKTATSAPPPKDTRKRKLNDEKNSDDDPETPVAPKTGRLILKIDPKKLHWRHRNAILKEIPKEPNTQPASRPAKKLYTITTVVKGERVTKRMSTSTYIKDHSRCVYIPELKEMSLPSALFFGMVPYTGVPFAAQKRYDLKINSEKLLMRTKEFVKECGGKGENFGIEFVKLFNRKFPEYLVTIYDKIIDPKSIAYQTPKKNDKCTTKKIPIFFDSEENRFYWINKLAAFFNFKKYCNACDEFMKSKDSHKRCPNANNADDSNDKSDSQKTESEESDVEENDNLESSESENEEDEQSENSESEEDEQSENSESEEDEQSENSESESEEDDESEDLPPPKPPKVDHKKILGGRKPIVALTRLRVLPKKKLLDTSSEDSDSSEGSSNLPLRRRSKKSVSRTTSTDSKATKVPNEQDHESWKADSVIDLNLEQYSLSAAIVLGRELHNEDDSKLKNLMTSKSALLEDAKELFEDCGGHCPTDFGIDFVKLFHEKYPQYMVTIYNNFNTWKSMLYRTPRSKRNDEKRISVFYDEDRNHYFCIRKVTAFFNLRKQCKDCDYLYQNTHTRCPMRLTSEDRDESDADSADGDQVQGVEDQEQSEQEQGKESSESQVTVKEEKNADGEQSDSSENVDDDRDPDYQASGKSASDDSEASEDEAAKTSSSYSITAVTPEREQPPKTAPRLRVVSNDKLFVNPPEENDTNTVTSVETNKRPTVITNTASTNPPQKVVVARKFYPIERNTGTGQKFAIMTLDDYKKCKKDSIVDLNVKQLRLPVALFIGKLLLDNKNDAELKEKLTSFIRDRDNALVLEEARKLVEECGGATSETEFDNDFIKLFNATHPEYLVTVFDKLTDAKSIMYKSAAADLTDKRPINIFYDEEENHYFCIKNLPVFFNEIK